MAPMTNTASVSSSLFSPNGIFHGLLDEPGTVSLMWTGILASPTLSLSPKPSNRVSFEPEKLNLKLPL